MKVIGRAEKDVIDRVLLLAVVLASMVAPAFAQAPRADVRSFRSEWAVIGGSGSSVSSEHRASREQTFYSIEWGRVITGEHGPGALRGRLEMAVEITPVFLAFQSDRAAGAGVSPLMFRWNLHERRRLAPFIEIAGGIVATNRDLPEGTTRMNFASHAGVGARVRLAGRWSAIGGYRFQHLSNGSIAERNPGINSNIGYAGLAYRR